jgi:hypothetical protein
MGKEVVQVIVGLLCGAAVAAFITILANWRAMTAGGSAAKVISMHILCISIGGLLGTGL